MEDNNFDVIVKLVIVGESSVGKTNLLLRYSDDKYDPEQKPTIGMDFLSKDVRIHQQSVKVQFWDTAGQEKYKAIASSYYKVASGVILVYDTTRRDSFDKLERWFDDIKNYTNKDLKIMLIGNKMDLEAERQVTTDEGKAFAEKFEMFFWETSAKSNSNRCVHKAFDSLIEECIKETIKLEMSHDFMHITSLKKKTSRVVDVNKQKKSGCC